MLTHHDEPATFMDACREYAANIGATTPNKPWILTDYDIWMPNPFYTGERIPHPESL